MILKQLLVCDQLVAPRQMDNKQNRPKKLSSSMKENSLRHYKPLNHQTLDSCSKESVSATSPEPLPDDNIRGVAILACICGCYLRVNLGQGAERMNIRIQSQPRELSAAAPSTCSELLVNVSFLVTGFR